MLYQAAKAVSECLTPREIAEQRTFPHLDRIVEVSRHVAINVAQTAVAQEVAPSLAKKYRSGHETGYIGFGEVHDSSFYSPNYDEIIFNSH